MMDEIFLSLIFIFVKPFILFKNLLAVKIKLTESLRDKNSKNVKFY
jgi:hypothetical protein